MSRLIALDTYLSPPALVVARGLSALGSLKRSSNRTLIIRPGGLGDLIVATAALADLGLDPAAFDWVVERRSAVWAAHLGLSFWCYDGAGVLPLLRLAGSRTLCINLEQRYGLAAAFARAAVARRGVLAGFASNRFASAYDRTTPYDPLDQHELDATQALFAGAIGVPRRPLRARSRAEPAGDHVVVAVAGTGNATRRRSGSEWVRMIRRYTGAERKILVTSPSDRELGNAITAALGKGRCGLAGTWEDVIAAVKSARRVFTVDGGMVHVASYYGVPVDAVFTAGRDRKWFPWSVGSRIIKRTDLDCQPCTIFGLVPECRWQYRCKDAGRWQILECDDLFPG